MKIFTIKARDLGVASQEETTTLRTAVRAESLPAPAQRIVPVRRRRTARRKGV
ncbi:MAG: hypothetical protein ACYCUG_06085 [Acidimicrobiales bacterium]